MKRHLLLAGVACAVLAGLPVVAAAQGADAAQSSGDIIVTAQKRSERLIDVPMSISAVSGDQLKNLGIVGTADLQQTTPGIVTVKNGFGYLPAIRGVQSSGTSPGDALNNAIYLDDVSVGAAIAGIFDLADIERIEVLKGPQGTLFGRNATGGAIRIFTRKPSFDPKGNVGVDYGFHYNEAKYNAYLTGPVSDTLALSVSATIRDGDGYIDGIGPNAGQTYGGPKNNMFRGKVLYRPSDNFEVLFSADTWEQQNDSVFISMVDKNAIPFPGSIPNGILTYAGGTQPKADLKGNGFSLDATWDVNNLTIRSITGLRHVEVQSQSDTDRTNLPISWNALSQKEDMFSEELTVSSPDEGMLTWIAGVYYFDGDASNPYFRQGTGDAVGSLGVITTNFTNSVKTEAVAGFGELTFNPTDRLHLTAGIRYSSETKDFHFQTLAAASPASFFTTNASKTWDSTTYRGVARYDFTDDANVYASVSTGFKSGVYNAYSPLNAPVNPEKVTAYEIGAKGRFNGITYTAAAYHYDYTDIQLNAYASINGQLLILLANAANAKMEGFEITAAGPIGGGFSFNAGLSYQPTSEYEDFKGSQVVIPIPGATGPINKQAVFPYDSSGSRTVRTPETTANLRLSYDTPLYGGDFMATVNASYTDDFFWQPGNFSEEPAYTLVNARASWKDGNRGLTYSVFGNNLTDEKYRTDLVANTRGADSVKIAPGYEIGIGVNFDF